jgi:hypothetical protein
VLLRKMPKPFFLDLLYNTPKSFLGASGNLGAVGFPGLKGLFCGKPVNSIVSCAAWPMCGGPEARSLTIKKSDALYSKNEYRGRQRSTLGFALSTLHRAGIELYSTSKDVA